MSNRDLPMMPWYPDQFGASTEAWSFAEASLYRCLLDAQWKLGVLPAEHERLARIAKLPVQEFEEAWKVVRPKFVRTKGGKLINKRLEEHRLRALNRKEEFAEAGRRGGKASAQARLKRGLKPGSSKAARVADSNRRPTLHSSHTSDKTDPKMDNSLRDGSTTRAREPRRSGRDPRRVVKQLAAEQSLNGTKSGNGAPELALGDKVRALAKAGNGVGDIVRLLGQYHLSAEQVQDYIAQEPK